MKIANNLKPNKEFIDRTKTIFLSGYYEKFGNEIKPTGIGKKYFVPAFLIMTALLILGESSAVYADKANVGTSSFLYPLKRVQESVNLSFAKNNAELELKYAERRSDEIKEIKKINPESKIIPNLVKDLKKSVSGSLPLINQIQEPKKGKNNDLLNTNGTPPNAQLQIPESSAPITSTSTLPQDSDDSIIPIRTTNTLQSRNKEESKRKNINICNSFKKLLENNMSDIKDIIEDNPDFENKYQSCLKMLSEEKENKEPDNLIKFNKEKKKQEKDDD